MAATTRICGILLSLAGCCHLRQLCSSYFTFSFSKQSSKDSNAIAEFKADSELTCALRCNTKGSCDEAAFHRESKKCFLYQKKDQVSIEPYVGDDNTRSRVVTMRKVRNIFVVVIWQIKISFSLRFSTHLLIVLYSIKISDFSCTNTKSSPFTLKYFCLLALEHIAMKI